MAHPTVATFQIGKNGLTEGVVESLSLALKHHKQVRISVLKSACRDRKKLQEMAISLQKKLPIKCNYRLIGYTIVLIKQKNKN